MKLDLARRHHKWENGGTTSLEQLQEQDDASGWLDQFSQPVLLSVDVSVAQCIQPIVSGCWCHYRTQSVHGAKR